MHNRKKQIKYVTFRVESDGGSDVHYPKDGYSGDGYNTTWDVLGLKKKDF